MSRWAPFLIFLLAAADPVGVLRIRTLPEVEVVWEGVSIGTTDAQGVLVVADVPPGAYTVTFRKDGYREARVRIEVEPGEETILPLRLEPSNPAANPEPRISESETEEPLLSQRLALLLLLLAAAGILFVYRAMTERSRAFRHARPPQDPHFTKTVGVIDSRRSAPAFLEDLSRREQTLDRLGEAAPPPGEIIEVEFTEVRPVEDEP